MYGEAAGKYPHVFSPLRVKNIIYKNRLCSTTMSTVPTHTHTVLYELRRHRDL